jgi:hypothetical protein
MNLQEFVRETLRQIIVGVKDAQEVCAESGGDINPQGLRFMPDQVGERRWDTRTDIFAEAVEFDVAVTVDTSSSAKGGIGIVVGAVSVGSVKDSEFKNGSISRIRFRVPVILPSGGRLRHCSGEAVTR